jgi:hypothetical protein
MSRTNIALVLFSMYVMAFGLNVEMVRPSWNIRNHARLWAWYSLVIHFFRFSLLYVSIYFVILSIYRNPRQTSSRPHSLL